MSRNYATPLATIALIVGIAAAGLVSYDLFFKPAEIESGIKKTWYSMYQYSISVPSSEAWNVISYLRLSFTVNPGESVCFSYTGTVRLDDSSDQTYVDVCFNIDGATPALFNPYQRVAGTTTGLGDWWYIPVALQHCVNLTAGAHTVTVQFRGNHTTDSLRQSTLLVQTYVP